MSKYNRRQEAASATATTGPTGGTAAAPPPDQFISFWQKVINKIVPHVGGFFLALIGGVIIAVIAWGVGQYTTGRKEEASELLATAMRTYQADLLGDKETASASDETPRFKTAKERAEATLATLDKLNKEFSGSDAAARGVLARAGVLFDLERYDDAETAYKEFIGQKSTDPALSALAREGLGLCNEARNRPDAALAIYQEPQVGDFYKDRFLLDQARIYLKKGDKKKAVELYKEILAKSPQTPLKDEVNNHIAALEQ